MAPTGKSRQRGKKNPPAASSNLDSTFATPGSSQVPGSKIDLAANFLRRILAENMPIEEACSMLRTDKGMSNKEISQALKLMRDPVKKNFKCTRCKGKNFSSFSARVNFQRHLRSHDSASNSKMISREEILSHWEHLSGKEKAVITSEVEARIQGIFEQSVAVILDMMESNPDSHRLPLELVENADRLAIIGSEFAAEFQLLEFLDLCSEGNVLCSDINKFVPPPYLPSKRDLETTLTELFAYYSCYLEKELVKSLINLKEGLAEGLADDLIRSEEEELKEKQRLNQQKRGKAAADSSKAASSGDAAARTSSDAAEVSGDAAEAASSDAAEAATSQPNVDLSSVRQRFLDVLRRFRFPNSKSATPYFKRQLESMHESGDLHLPIFYYMVKLEDKVLALIIRDHQKRVHESLKLALDQFILEMGYASKLSTNQIELDIVDFPPPKTTQPFLEYMKHKPVVEIFELLNPEKNKKSGKKVLLLTKFGRKLARYLLRYILKKHSEGWSLEGKFTAEDIEVLRGSIFRILNVQLVPASPDGNNADLMTYFSILKDNFCHVDLKCAPLFFDEFQRDLMKAPRHDSEKFEHFKKIILVHFSIMPPETWIELLAKIQQIVGSRRSKYIILDAVIVWVPQSDKWVSPFKDVYEHGVLEGYTTYTNTYWHLLRYCRNFPMHVLKLLEQQALRMVHQVGDATLAAILTADHFGNHLIDLFNYLTSHVVMDNKGVVFDEFRNNWVTFESSDDHNMDDDDSEL